jgi:hypothetical protein
MKGSMIDSGAARKCSGGYASASPVVDFVEGYLGDLVCDGAKFTELTELELMRDRARQIAADPEGVRQWNELRAS